MIDINGMPLHSGKMAPLSVHWYLQTAVFPAPPVFHYFWVSLMKRVWSPKVLCSLFNRGTVKPAAESHRFHPPGRVLQTEGCAVRHLLGPRASLRRWEGTHLLRHPCSARRTRAPSRWPGLSSWASTALQRNWPWQRRTWQQWGRWRGSSVRRCAVLQRGRDRRKDTSHLQPQTCGMEVCQNRSVTSVPVTLNRRDGCSRLTRII